jgi:predicted phosphodiesterase
MSLKPPSKVDVARQYRKFYGAKMPTLKLARIMYKENDLLFDDVEDARFRLRYIEGKAGGAHRGRASVVGSEYVIKEDRPKNPYSLPDSDETSYEPYILEGSRVFLMNDIHIPYHSIKALTAAFDFAKKENPDVILLNGDVLDFFGLSRFCKDPKKRSFAGELNTFKEFFQILDKEFPKSKKVLKIGNHEERYAHFLWQKAAELTGVDEFELENIIKARANGVEVIKDKRIINYYGLNIIHGHEFSSGFFSPVNVARGLYLRGKTSAIQGHNHQTSEHTESDMNGKITTTWSVGALCELHPAYAPINKWNHGFAMIDAAQDGFDVRNKRIFKGRVL